MEVLDYVCSSVTFSIPNEIRVEQVNKLVRTACENFVQEYEDEVIHIFYANVAPGKDRMCQQTISQLCNQASKTEKCVRKPATNLMTSNHGHVITSFQE